MSQLPEELKYVSSHEWVRIEGDNIAVIGITDHAQDALGDVVFVELPSEGEELAAGEEVAVVESVKAASDIYAPVSGVVIEVNELLEDEPELVNGSPYDDGWFFKVEMTSPAELDELLDAQAYEDSLEG